MNGIMSEVKVKLRQVSFLDNVSANHSMEAADLDPCSVLDRVADLHTELVFDGNWEPAMKKVDSGRIAVCSDVIKVIDASVQRAMIALVQKGDKNSSSGGGNKSTSTSKVTCHECGEAGHIRPNCPKLKEQKKKSNGAAGTHACWRRAAPKDGESHSKKVNGKDHFWCQKCRRWNTTHLTTQHRKKGGGDVSSSSTNPALAAALGMFQDDVADLSCSLVEVNVPSESSVSLLPLLILFLGIGSLLWRHNVGLSHLLTICQAGIAYLALLCPSFLSKIDFVRAWLDTLVNCHVYDVPRMFTWKGLSPMIVSFNETLRELLVSLAQTWSSNRLILLPPILWFGLALFLCFSGPHPSCHGRLSVVEKGKSKTDKERR
jgi:hypothetical protein